MRAGQQLTTWGCLATLLGVLGLVGCAGAPAPRPEPEVVEPQQAVPLGEVTGSRSFAEVMEQARRALERRDYREAARSAREAGQLAPDPEAARLLEAEALQAMGDGAGALSLWRDAVQAGPDRAPVWAAYARLAVRRGEGEAALALFATRLAGQPEVSGPEPSLFGVAGWTALAVGQGERAVAHLERTVGTPAEEVFRLALGRARLSLGQFPGAEVAARQAIDSAGAAAAEGWLLFGDVHREQGLAAGAREAYEKVLDLEPDNCAARVNLGVMTLQQGDPAAATELLQAAADGCPGAPEAWHNLGLAHRSQAHWQESREAYEAALKTDPGYTPALKNLGILIEKYLGRPGEALPYYDRYLELSPGDEEVQRWRKNAQRLAEQEQG